MRPQMRRSLVMSLLTALIVIGAVAASAGSSTAAGASSAGVCPLAGPSVTCCGPPINLPATAAVLSCCPQPPSTLCCPITAACVTPTMTIGSSPNPSVEGSPVTVSGRVLGAASGTAVTLWQELPGRKSFSKVATTTTSSSSTYTLRIGRSKARTDRAWYVASGGADSATIEQVVKAKVTVSVKAVTLAHGQTITLSGKIDPSHRGQRVRLEQKVGGGWRVLAHARLNRKSHYTIGHRWVHPGVVKLRIALAADQRNAASFSSVATLTLTG